MAGHKTMMSKPQKKHITHEMINFGELQKGFLDFSTWNIFNHTQLRNDFSGNSQVMVKHLSQGISKCIQKKRWQWWICFILQLCKGTAIEISF